MEAVLVSSCGLYSWVRVVMNHRQQAAMKPPRSHPRRPPEYLTHPAVAVTRPPSHGPVCDGRRTSLPAVASLSPPLLRATHRPRGAGPRQLSGRGAHSSTASFTSVGFSLPGDKCLYGARGAPLEIHCKELYCKYQYGKWKP